MRSAPLKTTVVPLREGDSWAMSTKLVVSPRVALALVLAVLPLLPEQVLSVQTPTQISIAVQAIQSHIKEIEYGISHSLSKSPAWGGGEKQRKASHHDFCVVPRQPKPRPPSLLLRGSNMFSTEHVSQHWSVNCANSSCSLNKSSHSYPWGIKWRNTVMLWIVQGLSRFSYQLYQEGIITGKLKFKPPRLTQRVSHFAKFRRLSLCFTFGFTESFCDKGLCKPTKKCWPKLEFEATFCSCSRTLGSHLLVQEVIPWHHSVFRDVHSTPQAWCRWDGSWDETGSWCITMGQWSPQIFHKTFCSADWES